MPRDEQQRSAPAPGPDSGDISPTSGPPPADQLRTHIRRLVLMKETGPKSAAWHRARVRTIWRLQRQAESLESPPADQPNDR